MALAQESLAGVIERVTFHQPDSGFCVLQLKAPGHKDLVAVVGHASTVTPGEYVEGTGQWVIDREYGRQFRADTLRLSAPTTPAGIEKYLGSGLVKGIGPVYAHRLVAQFGAEVLTIIESDPDRLQQVAGIGPGRSRRILQGWHEQKTIRAVMVFLHSHGVSTAQAVRIAKQYGDAAIDRVQENPYRLTRDIRGIGFKSADKIAAHLGMTPTDPRRVRAGVSFALLEATGQGHCGLPVDDLVRETVRLLDVPADLVRDAIAYEQAQGTVVPHTIGDRDCVFLAGLAHAEQAVAARLQALAIGAPPWPAFPVDSAVTQAEARFGLTLAPSQRAAVRDALTHKLTVITGGPGVGKTTLVRTLLAILAAHGVRPVLCAPTGRAAKRLSDTSGHPAQTIHRLLGAQPGRGFAHDEDDPLVADLVVVDECSMIDVTLMHHLLRAIPPQAGVLLVGDADQLPSVGPGQVFRDILTAGTVPIVRLTEVFRQAAHSRIVVNAHRINRGELPTWDRSGGPHQDFYFVEATEPADAADKIVRLVTERIPHSFGLDPIRDVQVLCPMNRGDVGARHLNERLQQVLNPPGPAAVDRFGWHFGPGDKVMQTVNDYDKDVFNGDIGRITAVRADDQELTIRFDDRDVLYDFADLDALVPAYATTIHKAQGSEYPAVVIPVTTQHYVMLQRPLLYTAVTRGQRLVVLVGQAKALALAVRTQATGRRWSKLAEWLAGGVRA
ncbi:MAG: SF1B family DNA helicase RecD2 [Clostridia bacterium]